MLTRENYSFVILCIALCLLGIHFLGKKQFISQWKPKYIFPALLWLCWFAYEQFYIIPWMKTLPPHDPVIRVDALLIIPVSVISGIVLLFKWIRLFWRINHGRKST